MTHDSEQGKLKELYLKSWITKLTVNGRNYTCTYIPGRTMLNNVKLLWIEQDGDMFFLYGAVDLKSFDGPNHDRLLLTKIDNRGGTFGIEVTYGFMPDNFKDPDNRLCLVIPEMKGLKAPEN